jgi:hypothetical protein
MVETCESHEHDAPQAGAVLAYEVLGPMRVLRDGEPLRLGGAQQRAVPALLVLEANTPVLGLLGHRRTDWLRLFLLLARRSAGDGAAGDVDYALGAVTDVEDDGRGAALQWSPEAGAQVFTTFSGRVLVRERDGQVAHIVQGNTRGGNNRVNACLLTRLVELLAGALAAADLVAG